MGINPIYYLDEMSQDEVNSVYTSKQEYDRLNHFWEYIIQNGNKTVKKPSDLYLLSSDKDTTIKSTERQLTKEEFLNKASKIR